MSGLFREEASRSTSRTLGRFLPTIEALENRLCPTTVTQNGNVLHIEGDNAANTVSIVQNDVANTLTVMYDSGGVTQTNVFTSSQITRLDIDLRGGADRLDYTLNNAFTLPNFRRPELRPAGPGVRNLPWNNFLPRRELTPDNTFSRPKSIEVDLGSGTDRATFDLGQAGLLPGRTIKAQLDIDLEAGHDADQVWVDIGAVDSAVVTVEVDMGSGDDILYAGIWGDVQGNANVRFDLDGGDDNDVLRFAGRRDSLNNAYGVDIAAQASLTVNMDGGDGRDLVRANMINEIDGNLTLLVEGGSGNDSGLITEFGSQVLAGVSASVRVNPMSTGTLNARVRGNRGNDAMGFTFENQSAGIVNIQNALLDGGDGTDNFLEPPSAGVTVNSIP
jgi:hypothetical protein